MHFASALNHITAMNRITFKNSGLLWRCTNHFYQRESLHGGVIHKHTSTAAKSQRVVSHFKAPCRLSTHYANKPKYVDAIRNTIPTCSAAPFHTSVPDHAQLPPVKTPNFVKTHRENLKGAPIPALVLGFSGLIPFIVPTLYTIGTMSCSCNVAYAQMAYGATILSFLGGVRWGLTLTESSEVKPNLLNLGYSVTPSLIAWLGLLMPLQPSIACVASGLLLAAVIDNRMKGYPGWFKSLRFFLSTFAIVSLGIVYGYSLVFPPEEPESGVNWYKLVRIARIIVED